MWGASGSGRLGLRARIFGYGERRRATAQVENKTMERSKSVEIGEQGQKKKRKIECGINVQRQSN